MRYKLIVTATLVDTAPGPSHARPAILLQTTQSVDLGTPSSGHAAYHSAELVLDSVMYAYGERSGG